MISYINDWKSLAYVNIRKTIILCSDSKDRPLGIIMSFKFELLTVPLLSV